MNAIIEFYQCLMTYYGLWSIIILGLLGLSFFIQTYYYVGRYGRIPMFRPPTLQPREVDGVSVIVVVEESEYFISELLPALLTQDYKNFEILVVDLLHNDEYSQSLQTIAEHNPKLRVWSISQKDERYLISNKMALNIGIKEARYENIILTTVNVMPKSNKWLAGMAAGFSRGEVVLSYCPVQTQKGFSNKLIRCSKLMRGANYLSSAIQGKPYRGDIHNIGFTKNTYFTANGFNYLNLRMGEDDLFIQSIATKHNTTLVLSAGASMQEIKYGGIKEFNKNNLFLSSSFKFYPRWAKGYIRTELFSRAIFFLSLIAVVSLLPLGCKIFAGVMFLLRLLIMLFEINRLCQRLGEKKLLFAFIVYDIVSIYNQCRLSLIRLIKHPKGVWR